MRTLLDATLGAISLHHWASDVGDQQGMWRAYHKCEKLSEKMTLSGMCVEVDIDHSTSDTVALIVSDETCTVRWKITPPTPWDKRVHIDGEVLTYDPKKTTQRTLKDMGVRVATIEWLGPA